MANMKEIAKIFAILGGLVGLLEGIIMALSLPAIFGFNLLSTVVPVQCRIILVCDLPIVGNHTIVSPREAKEISFFSCQINIKLEG